MSEHISSFQRVEELDGATAEALLGWTLSLADTKHKIGVRTSEWINGGPALEAAVGAAAITQDELGHARSLFAMLRDFPGAPEGMGAENDLEARQEYFCPRLLNAPWPSWLDVIATNVLMDRALSVAVGSFRDSAYGPLRGRAAKMLQEETFHRIFGDGWLRRLAAWDESRREQLQASLGRFWRAAVTWFGPHDDPATAALCAAGILSDGPASMRRRWLEEVTPVLDGTGLVIPEEEIEWSGWNPRYRDLEAA